MSAFLFGTPFLFLFLLVFVEYNHVDANLQDIEAYFREHSSSGSETTSGSLKLVFSRDIDYDGLKSSEPRYFDTTLNQVMTNYNDSNVETLFRLYFPYGVNEVLKAFKLYPTVYVQYVKNYSHANYLPNVTDFLLQSAKFNVKLYKSCRLFSQIDNTTVFDNATCYTAGIENYQKIAGFLTFYYNTFGSNLNTILGTKVNMSQVLYNLRRFLININDMSDSVKSLSFPCHVIGFNSSATNPSSPDFLTPTSSDSEHLVFSRTNAPFKITPNYANPLWWSNIYETSVFIADDLSSSTGYIMNTTDARALNKQVLQFAGLSETLFLSELYNLSSINWTNPNSSVSGSTKLQTLCRNTIKALIDNNNNNLFSSYYQGSKSLSFNNSRPLYLLEPTSLWVSVEMNVPFYAKLSDTVYPHVDNNQFSGTSLNESVFVTVRFPIWNPNYDIIQQHQNVYDTNDYLFEKIVSLFDCNTFFFNFNGMYYSPFYLSPKYREYLSQFISLVDWTNFYKMNWGFFQIWSNYDKVIYDERGFDYCYKNISPFNLGKTTGSGVRGLYTYIDTGTVNIPSISWRTYATYYDGTSTLVNFSNLVPDIYHPTFMLNDITTPYRPEPFPAVVPAAAPISPIPYRSPIVPVTPTGSPPTTTSYTNSPAGSSPQFTPTTGGSTTITISPQPTEPIVTFPPISPDSIWNDTIDEIDEDVLGHYNLSNTSGVSGVSTTGERPGFLDQFSIGRGINNGWSIVLIVLAVIVVLLVGIVIRYRTKKSADQMFSYYTEEDDPYVPGSFSGTRRSPNRFRCMIPTWQCPSCFSSLRFRLMSLCNRDYGSIVPIDTVELTTPTKNVAQDKEKLDAEDEESQSDYHKQLLLDHIEKEKLKDIKTKQIQVYTESPPKKQPVSTKPKRKQSTEATDDEETDDPESEAQVDQVSDNDDEDEYVTISDKQTSPGDSNNPEILKAVFINVLAPKDKEKDD